MSSGGASNSLVPFVFPSRSMILHASILLGYPYHPQCCSELPSFSSWGTGKVLCSFFRHGASKMGTAIPGSKQRTLPLWVSQTQTFLWPCLLDYELPRKDEKWLEDGLFPTLTRFLTITVYPLSSKHHALNFPPASSSRSPYAQTRE